jgi:hypothetical protein
MSRSGAYRGLVTSLPPDGTAAASGPVTPEIVGGPGETGSEADDADGEHVTRPTRLIRIASMVRALLDEARRAPLDDAGRRSLREIHERSIQGLEDILSDDLKQELEEVTLPFTSDTPSESELRIAQAQLVGWLEGLFHGIQATLFTQQVAAQRQLEDMRGRRAIEMGGAGPGGVPTPERPPGAYL